MSGSGYLKQSAWGLDKDLMELGIKTDFMPET
jgi:hypothetical protein